MPTSPDTLLRRIKSAPEAVGPLPRYVGVDDWAWKKGHRYGTILIDLERRCVIDILPGRDGEALKVWLREHPGVEVISRDRWAAFAQASTEAAPQAKQVADRWHLLKNLREAIERLLERRYSTVRDALKSDLPTAAPTAELPTNTAVPEPTPPCAEPTPRSPRQEARHAKRQRRVERFERARQLHAEGTPIRRIAAMLGISREAVERYVRQPHCPDWGGRRAHPTRLNRFRDTIDARISAGTANAAAIHRELSEQGCRESYYAIRRFVRRRRLSLGVTQRNAAPPRPAETPSAIRLSFELFRRPENRDADEDRHVHILHEIPDLQETLDLTDQFVGMVRKQVARPLAEWLASAEKSASPELRGFAKGVRLDEAAVAAAMTEPWSNGQVEGQVNRLKAIKRQMFGRAGFNLLRARVRHAA
jgi:transposase